MSLTNLFEEFGPEHGDPIIITDEAMEEQRLQAFENGYKAGWDDASKAHGTEQSHISSDLARNLQDLSTTFQDAKAALMKEIQPLLETIVTTLLPRLAEATMAPRIVEEMTNLIREVGGGALVVSVAPGTSARLQDILDEDQPVSVSFQEDPTLGNGQAFLRIGDRERMVDLDGAIESIAAVITNYFGGNPQEAPHE